MISVVHDLSLAKAYGTHALLLSEGRVLACGKTRDVFSEELLEETFSMDIYGWMRRMLGQWN